MVTRRSGPPPFEVMRRQLSDEAEETQPPPMVPQPRPKRKRRKPDQPRRPLVQAPPVETTHETGDEPEPAWKAWLRRPLVFSAPAGMLVAAGVVVLFTVTLAYVIGRSSSTDPAPANAALGGHDPSSDVRDVPVIPPPAGNGQGGNGRSGYAPPSHTPPGPQAAASVSNGPDPRTEGHNYFALAYCPQDEASRLVEFLAGQGVEAIALRANNRSQFQVYALRGFPPGQVSSSQRTAYQNRLKKAGRAWREHRNGGSDLSDLYLEKYTGRPIDRMIAMTSR